MSEALELWHAAKDSGPIGFFILVAVLVFGQKQIFSEKMAEKFGLFGVIGRKIRAAKERRIARDIEITNRVQEDLKAEIRRVDRARKEAVECLQAQLDDVQLRNALKQDYILWITRLYFNLELWAATNGLRLPEPPFLSFQEWIDAGQPAFPSKL